MRIIEPNLTIVYNKPMKFSPTEYSLVSAATGTKRPDTEGWTLAFPDEPPALIRASYKLKQIHFRDNLEGIYRYADWLPIRRILDGSAAPLTWKSQAFAKELGLSDLWITFNGWWPDRGGYMRTGTFKECEAYSVCGRMDAHFQKILVVASAGNTARAFAHVCSDNNIPLLLFVPEDNLEALWFAKKPAKCIKLVSPASGCDYYDAIRMSDIAARGSNRFIAEGGAKNVARRDGMGTSVLSAAEAIGRIPDVYVQAVGSGTGAIAAWETAMRLEADGRFGPNRMRLVVSQNQPFTPLADSWQADSRKLIIADHGKARKLVEQVKSKVLTNRQPPWAVPGGLYDALKATGGAVYTVSNDEAAAAEEKFFRLEGCHVDPAAAVAAASLEKSIADGSIDRNETIMLNITGAYLKPKVKPIHHMLTPSVILPQDTQDGDIIAVCEHLFDAPSL